MSKSFSEELRIGRAMAGQLAAIEHQFIDMIMMGAGSHCQAKLIEDIAHRGGIRAAGIEYAAFFRAKRGPEQSTLASGHVRRSKVLVRAGVQSSAPRLRAEGAGSELLTRIGPPTQPWHPNPSDGSPRCARAGICRRDMLVDVDDRQGSHALRAERRDARRLSLVVGLPDRLALRQRARRHDVLAAGDLLRHEAARDVEQRKTAWSPRGAAQRGGVVGRKLGEIDARSLVAVMIVAGDKNEVSKLRIRTREPTQFCYLHIFL